MIAVLDLDALNFGAFDAEDKAGLEAVARLVAERCDWPTQFRPKYAVRRAGH